MNADRRAECLHELASQARHEIDARILLFRYREMWCANFQRIETQILTEGISLVHQMINRPSYSTRSLRGIAKGLSKIRKCVNSHLRLLSDDWKRNGREIHNATRNQSCCRWISGQLADIAQRIETEN
jgi:hypothetical protein